jgi:ribosomal protein S18 acetylase RimI-like enzyme
VNTQLYRDSIQQHGVGATLFYGAYRAANKVTKVALLNGLVLTLESISGIFLEDPRRKQVRELSPEQMRKYVGKAESSTLAEEGIELAKARKDRCFAMFDGDVLTSYGWYSTKPTELIELGHGIVLHFDSSYAYMYNGFTHPKYRGQRLHAIGMAAACAQFAKEGQKGLVSYVEASNFASLKSCFRMGYESFGHVAVLKVGGRYLSQETPGCKKFGFRVEA